MLIGIDGNEANINSRVGVHQYAYELLWAMYRLNKEWNTKHKVLVYLKKPPKNDLPGKKTFWEYEVLSGKGLWVITKLMPRLLKKPRPDVFFTPSHYLPPISLMPRVCSIHDLGYLKFSGQFKKYDFWQLKYWTAISIYVSKYIISVSESTKRDIVRHYPFASKKIDVAYHGYDKARFNTKISINDVRRVKKKYKINRNYILFLSLLKPSKNIEGLLEAYKVLITTYGLRDTKLVIAGKRGWLFEPIFKKVKDLELEEDVIFTGFVSEEDKPALLKGARVFASPSFWEGFGIHVLEAMACGTPVVVSSVASLPEVVGNVGMMVDPNDNKSIADGLRRVLGMSEIKYNKLVDNTIKQANKFNWEKSAKQTLEVLERAYNGNV